MTWRDIRYSIYKWTAILGAIGVGLLSIGYVLYLGTGG